MSRYPILPGGLLLLALAGCGASTDSKPAPVAVSYVELQPQAVTVSRDYVARTEAHNTAEIRPRTGGLLEKQIAVEGDRVRRGQLLFVIDPQPYEQALAQAQAGLQQAQAAARQAERDQARIAPLSKVDAASQQELDAVVARLDAARGAVSSARATLRTAQLNLDYTQVRSPIDGVVGRALLRVGALVTPYQTLLTTVYSTDLMYINYSVSEQRFLEVQRQKGGRLENVFDNPPVFHIALSDGSIYPLPAKLDFIDPAVDIRTGTLAVRLIVPNPDQVLRTGQFARVVVDADQIPDALLVPQRAVQQLQGHYFIWVIDPTQHAERRDVTMGPRIQEQWVIASGARPGEKVVVDGAQKLRAGSELQPAPLVVPPAGHA